MLREESTRRTTTTATWIASANEVAILRHLYASGPAPRSLLAKATGLTNAAISRITRRLVENEILQEGSEIDSKGKPGRKFVALDLGTNAYLGGIGVQAVSQWVELMNLRGEVVARKAFDVGPVSDADAVLAKCCQEMERLIASRGINRTRVLGIGVGIAGVVDTRTGTVLRAENLGWAQIAVRRKIEKHLALPVHVENLRNCMILGSNHLPAIGERSNAMMIIASLGIGASLIVDGRHLVAGAGFAAGQIGHTRVAGAKDQCACGRVGCLDTVASGRAILKHLGLLPSHKKSGEDSSRQTKLLAELVERAQHDARVVTALRRAGRALGDVLGAAITLVDPDCIFLTGILGESDHYFSAAEDRINWYKSGTSAQTPILSRVSAREVLVPARAAFTHFVVSSELR